MKRILALCLAFLLLIVSTAMAADVAFSPVFRQIQEFEKALEETYGLTPEMYTFFSRKITQDGDTTRMVLTGANDFYYVLGTYTAWKDGSGLHVSWSHEGEDTSGGFSATAWGRDQLNEMIQVSRKLRMVEDFYVQALEIAEREDEHYSMPLDTLVTYPDSTWTRAESPLGKMSLEELQETAIAAVVQRFGLNEEQVRLIREQLEEDDLFYVDLDGKTCFQVWLNLYQDVEAAPDGIEEWIEADGQYVVFLDVDTGEVLDIIYDSLLNGNG